MHLTAITGKDITKDYYQKPISYVYWNSYSNGGRQGLIEAQRFPEDFDGVVANAPWLDQTGFRIGALWNQRALDEAPLTAANLSLLADKVMAKCDARQSRTMTTRHSILIRIFPCWMNGASWQTPRTRIYPNSANAAENCL